MNLLGRLESCPPFKDHPSWAAALYDACLGSSCGECKSQASCFCANHRGILTLHKMGTCFTLASDVDLLKSIQAGSCTDANYLVSLASCLLTM